jgi:hypothetical protein
MVHHSNQIHVYLLAKDLICVQVKKIIFRGLEKRKVVATLGNKI